VLLAKDNVLAVWVLPC